MCQVKRDGLKVEFVVIDNNSSDHTKEVVEAFADRLPLCYLFEPRPGKNCALNKALDTVALGRIVVFTDDDVNPLQDWLLAIHGICERWPNHAVFGGKVLAIWPEGTPPIWWRRGPSDSGWGLANHDLGASECIYPTDTYGTAPCGANMWVRRDLFATGKRFDESVGPHPTNRIMGSETSFTCWATAHGYAMVWSPHAVVGHRIQKTLTTPSGIKRRAWANGRGGLRAWGLPRQQLFEARPFAWTLLRLACLMWAAARYAWAMKSLSHAVRLNKSLHPLSDIAYNLEALRVTAGSRGSHDVKG